MKIEPMSRVYDDERLAGAYERGNEMPERALRAWVELIGSFAPRSAPVILEVGAGTGVFSDAMARWIEGSEVVGVDASEAMLGEARRHHSCPGVRYLPGEAEALPVGAGGFDLALMSRVIHHIPDRVGAGRELVRVLREGGRVVVRTTFRERLDAAVYDYWPQLRASDARRFPGEAEVVEDFVAAGLVLEEVTSFAQPVVANLAEYHARLVGRPQSKFNCLTDEDFRQGLARLETAAGGEDTGPVLERYDVAVFSRP
ncbi:class I SAM-dependent methyltransferase [Streptomyces smaragdinus]|uniref:class I SAM-dependent methyltransferase n=1 Tax=Streptomyces smaragdinus TaxID=2585196 RepID=UPI002B21452B|nr:class I SAM-dependent methyltransferase [Streptomyces smaragdinus]